MALSAEWRPDLAREVNAHTGFPVGPEAQAVVDKRGPSPDCGPPPIVPGDVGSGHIAEWSLHADEPEGCLEEAVVGDCDTVLRWSNTEREPHRRELDVECVAEEPVHGSLVTDSN